MRVIAGKYRSRNIESLPGNETRPTYDRLKETLFNILQSAGVIEGATFLDLFAGTGSVGIEALSRGAERVVFVESNRKAANLIRSNLKSLNIDEGADVFQEEVADALPMLMNAAEQFDIVFLDPPYALAGEYGRSLRLLSTGSLLKPHSLVIAEHDKRFEPGEDHSPLKRYRRLDQGDSALSFYRLA
jgi:16S rRNA (guanine(966)-N(2))-methyltransferase RsmD